MRLFATVTRRTAASRVRVPGIVLAAIACLQLVACGRGSAPQGAAGTPPPPPVQVITVEPRDVPIFREFVGQTRGKQDVDVRARVQGYLQSINFEQGSEVKAGDLLFTLDKRPYEAELAQARAAEAQLRSQYQQAASDAKRYTELKETGVIARQQAEQSVSQASAAAAALDAQRAVVKARQVDLTFTDVRAPISGRISLTPYSVGDLVGTGAGTEKPLATISDLTRVRVRFSISEADYLRYVNASLQGTQNPQTVREQNLQLTLADGSIYPHLGAIVTADNAIDPATGTLTVEAEFANPEGILRTGQYAKVRVTPGVLKGAIVVPARAVQEQQGITSVAVVGPDNRVQMRTVQVGERSADNWAITSGLEAGERVIVEGLTRVSAGAVVNPEEVKLAQAPADSASPPSPAPAQPSTP